MQGLAAVLANTGYMGIPLISAVFGREAAVPIVVGLTLDGILIIPLGIVIIESSKGSAESLPATALTTFLALARNPLILSIFAGLAASAVGLDTPTPWTISWTCSAARRAPAPCSPSAPRSPAVRSPAALAEVSYMTFMKLVLHPAALFLTTTLLFDVQPLWATAALLGAALPIAANVFIVARQYDVYVVRTSSAILVSTAVSIVSVSALLLVLN